MLTYAIADMHGRYDLLLKASHVIQDDSAGRDHRVIVLGDFVDRGPQSREIIEWLMLSDWIVLQGNHEDIMLQTLDNPARNLKWWVRNGGGETLKSYGYQDGDGIHPLRVPQSHIDWLKSLPVYFMDRRRIFVHAGVPYDQAVTETKKDTMQWMLHPSDTEHYFGAEIYADEPHCSGLHIVHGHHQSATHPLLKPHRTNLDSFAWYTGRLAIGVFDETQDGPVRVLEAIN